MAPQTLNQVMLDVGRRVAEARAALGITQEALAEKMGMSVDYVRHLEWGDQNLTLQSLVRLANALDVSVRFLFEEPLSRERPRPGRPRGKGNKVKPRSRADHR